MSTQVQWRRGNASEHNSFIGANAEITVDTTDWTLRVHDGYTVGGYQLVSNIATQTLHNKTLVTANLSGHTTTISGNLLPSENITYNLGSNTNRFKDLWLSGNSIYLGGAVISVSGSQLLLTNPAGGQFVVDATANYNLQTIDANIGSIKVLLDYEVNFLTNLNSNVLSYQSFANTRADTFSANLGSYQRYANANVVAIQANLGSYQTYANANVVAIQANLGAYQTYANANVVAIQANLGAYQTYANTTTDTFSANLGAFQLFANSRSDTFSANLGAYQTYANANVVAIQANLGAYQTYANANVVAIQDNLGAYQTYANANVVAIQANLGAYQTYTNANIGTATTNITTLFSNAASQQVQINNIVSQANANTAAYITQNSISTTSLSITSGTEALNPTSGALVVTGGAGISGNLFVAGNIFVNNLVSLAATTISVQDPLLYLTANTLTPYNFDIGFYSQFIGGSTNNYQHTGLARNYTNHVWGLFSNVISEPGTTISWNDSTLIWDTLKLGALTVANSTISTSTSTGALVVAGGAGIGGALYIANAGDVSANIGTLVNNNNTNNANIGAFQTYANTKIGTNTNSNLVVVSNTQSTSTTTGALISAGGHAITTGNLYIGGSGGNAIVSVGDNYNQGNIWATGATNTGLKTNQTTAYVFNETATTVRIGGAATSITVGATTGAIIPNANAAVNLGSEAAYWGTTFTGNIVSNAHVIGGGGLVSAANISIPGIVTGTTNGNLIIDPDGSGWVVFTPVTPVWMSDVLYNVSNIQATSTTTGSQQISGGMSIATGNLYIGGSAGNSIVATGDIYDQGNLWVNNTTNAGLKTNQTTAYVFNETATIIRIGGGGVTEFDSNTQATSTTTGAVQITGGVSINTGNLFIGGSAGNAITVSGNVIPSGNVITTNNLGSDTRWWNAFYGVSTQARYADLAENYQADSDYDPGTVLVFGGENEVTISTITHDTSVAGIVSTNPAHLMNSALRGPKVVPLALQGRVPCLVQGPVNKGTILVTSSTPGVAEAMNISLHRPGCVLGKSLEKIDDNSIKLIEVVVGRF